MTKLYSLLAVAAFFLTACKTASKAYNKGDYADAIELGVKQLQKNPSDDETKSLIKSAYAYAVSAHEENIRALSGSTNESRYEGILREYLRLQDLYATVQESPAAVRAINPRSYADYVQTYRDKVADVHLDAAERFMSEGSKLAYRNAFNEYCYALRYRDNAALRAKRDAAYDAAITKVLVVPIQNYGGYSYASSYQLQQFQTDVMRTLASNMNGDFVRFYSEWDLRNKNTEADQVLELNMGRIRIGQPLDQRSQRTVSKQVVSKEIVHKPDSVTKEYATVYATITSTQRTLLSEGELYITLRDPRGRTLWNDRFSGEHRWQTQFASYTGDQRALSDADKALVNQPQNSYNVPREEEIMSELYRRIQSDLSSRLRNYYSRF